MSKKQSFTLLPKDFSFTNLADAASYWAGSPVAFVCAIFIVITWLISGIFYDFSDSWQIVISSITCVITFLLVFLIQHSQIRDTRAIHIKLSELIRSTKGAHTGLIDLEKLNEDELAEIHACYNLLAEAARRKIRKGGDDTGVEAMELSKELIKK